MEFHLWQLFGAHTLVPTHMLQNPPPSNSNGYEISQILVNKANFSCIAIHRIVGMDSMEILYFIILFLGYFTRLHLYLSLSSGQLRYYYVLYLAFGIILQSCKPFCGRVSLI